MALRWRTVSGVVDLYDGALRPFSGARIEIAEHVLHKWRIYFNFLKLKYIRHYHVGKEWKSGIMYTHRRDVCII